MYVNMQCNIIVQAYFMEACYNQVRDWWFGPLLHDTDQPREMLTTDQSPRDLRSLRLWSVPSISLSWSVSCNSDHITSLIPLNIEYCNMYIENRWWVDSCTFQSFLILLKEIQFRHRCRCPLITYFTILSPECPLESGFTVDLCCFPLQSLVEFHEDLYPDTASGRSALSLDDWLSGQNQQVSIG